MKLSLVKIIGFRNFKNASISLNEKTLVIGTNDIGKTNLIWAIRILLDRGLSDIDIEPKDSDFYAYEDTNNFQIILKFEDVIEDCIVAKLKGMISDDDKLFISYEATRDSVTNSKSYKILIGPSEDAMGEVQERYYRKVLNIKYISSNRDFWGYIQKEKNSLFQIAKDDRDDKIKAKDDVLYSKIADELSKIDKEIPRLSYIKNATLSINTELSKMSVYHKNQKIVFNSATSNIDNFISSTAISSEYNEKKLLIGGDGRLNQVYLSLWAAKNSLKEDNMSEVSLVCIEEPEVHLHPHQQRKLAEYLNSVIKGQVIITSHSAQITSEFSPNSIVRLLNKGDGTIAASEGCSEIIEKAFEDFGYRMSIIPAEAFFADCVLLVEGASEVLFYKTLAKQLEIDLDRLNISVLSAEGVGFKVFIEILDSLKISWVLRTDNDIFKVPKKKEYRFAGIQRIIDILKDHCDFDKDTEEILDKNKSLLRGFNSPIPPQENIDAVNLIKEDLAFYSLFLANKDLENDMFESPLKKSLIQYYSKLGVDADDIVSEMQNRKASSMLAYLRKNKTDLLLLKDDLLAEPLFACKDIIEKQLNEAD